MRRNVPKIAYAAACKAVFAENAAHKFFDRCVLLGLPVPPRTAQPIGFFNRRRRSRPAGSIGLCGGSYCRRASSAGWVNRQPANGR